VSEIIYRAPQIDDAERLRGFVGQVPEGEQRFLKEDLADIQALLAGWMHEMRAERIFALDGDEIVGSAQALPQVGWSSHVAELRLIVAASHRGRGLGRELARRALIAAIELGCSQVYVEVVAEQEALVAMFQELGFAPEALLRDFVRDSEGESHDLMILTHHVDEQWGHMEALGLGDVSA
jgi:RimJ/RimL family protein N-acetyltransferase